ncbi:MAG: hypothetical protein ACREMY_23660, partial [bacterium]
MSAFELANARTLLNERVSAFLAWWRFELVASMPMRLRASFAPDTRYTTIRLADDGVEVYAVRRRGRARGEHLLAGGDISRLASFIHENKHMLGRIFPVYLRVPISRCLLRTVTVPRAARHHLEGLLALDLERATPFKRADVFSGVVVPKDEVRETGTIEVKHLIFKANAAAAVLDALASAGVGLAGAEIEDEAGTLLPVRLNRDGDQRARLPPVLAALNRLTVGLFVAVVLTAAAAVGIALYQQEQLRLRLTAETVALQREAAAIRARVAAAGMVLAEASSLRLRKENEIGLVLILEELSRVLPDDAWLTELQVLQDGIVID